MAGKKLKLQGDGSIQKPKRLYIIGYLSKNEAGESVISNASPVQFFSDHPELKSALISPSKTPKPGKRNGRNSRDLKRPPGASNEGCGQASDLESFTFTREVPPL